MSLLNVSTAALSSAEASLRREEAGEREIRKRAVDDKNAKDRTTGRAPAFFSPLIVHHALTIFIQDKTRLRLTLLQPDIT